MREDRVWYSADEATFTTVQHRNGKLFVTSKETGRSSRQVVERELTLTERIAWQLIRKTPKIDFNPSQG